MIGVGWILRHGDLSMMAICMISTSKTVFDNIASGNLKFRASLSCSLPVKAFLEKGYIIYHTEHAQYITEKTDLSVLKCIPVILYSSRSFLDRQLKSPPCSVMRRNKAVMSSTLNSKSTIRTPVASYVSIGSR
jgi:hypothetical protein